MNMIYNNLFNNAVCKKVIFTFLLLAPCCTILKAQQQIKNEVKTSLTNIKEFQNQRFGLFIHWGPVTLRGTEIGWSRDTQVEKEDYDNLYKEFNPVLFNADAWVKTAKDAGMKYLVITARHHDGFCLWPTKYTNYNIMNTPYKKDIVGALNTACKKQGIKFCIYYSILDWYNPNYPIHSVKNSTIDPKADMSKYITYMKNQLKELITNYDPYLLWFDGGWEQPWTNEIGKDMYAYLKRIKPNLIINNRLGKEMTGTKDVKIDYKKMIGDFDTPEKKIGRMNMEVPWESCFTICNQWAWKPNDAMKPLPQCLKIFSQTVGGNGNLLLNVGPMPDGRIEARQITRLKEMGDWLKTNGKAVYGTLGGPYEPTNIYATTRKGNKVFLYILKTDTTAIELKNIPGRKIIKAYTMNNDAVSIERGKETFKVRLPANWNGKLEYVIVLELDGDAETIPVIK